MFLTIWSLAWFAVFLIVTGWNLISPWPNAWWGHYTFYTSVVLAIVVTVVTTVWFTWGGLRDLRRLVAQLRTLAIDNHDGAVTTTTTTGETLHDVATFPTPGVTTASLELSAKT